MSGYKLTYFNGRGRAEVSRWMLAAADQSYEDVRVEFANWPTLKDKTPFGFLPLLEVDGVTLTQSAVIARFLARRLGLAGKGDLDQGQVDMVSDYANDMFSSYMNTLFGSEDGKAACKKSWDEGQQSNFLVNLEKLLSSNKDGTGYFVGGGLTVADLSVATGLDMMGDSIDLKPYPKLQAHKAMIEAQPGIAKWLAARPTTPW